MRWSIGRKMAGGFGLATLLLVILSCSFFMNLNSLLDNMALRAHAYEHLRIIDEIYSTMIDAQNGQRGFLITGVESFLEPYTPTQSALKRLVEELRIGTLDNPVQQNKINQLAQFIDDKFQYFNETIELRRLKRLDEVMPVETVSAENNRLTGIRQLINQMISDEEEILESRKADAQHSAEQTEYITILMTLLIVTVVSVSSLLITRNITKPLQQVIRVSESVTAGDLTIQVPQNGRTDEVGILMRAFYQMVNKLRTQLQLITDGTNAIASSSNEISVSVTQLSSSSSETAASVGETTTTVEEVRQTAQMVNQKAEYVASTARQTQDVSQVGKKASEDVTAGINRIQQQMASIGESIMRLSEQSQAIGEIISTVDDLTDQSNLLSVNAAIEAARAGEQGKGFTVVAQEIKSLADRSKQATLRVRAILNEIQQATSASVIAVEQGNKVVETGVDLAARTGDSILALSNSIVEANQAATQIAASTQQQLAGVDQVAAAMGNIKTAVSQNVASSKLLDDTARNLTGIGRKLQSLVAGYKV